MMWNIVGLTGLPLPIVLLFLSVFGSLLCAHIISAEQYNEDISSISMSTTTAANIHSYKSKPVIAFINNGHVNNYFLEFLIPNRLKSLKKIKHQATTTTKTTEKKPIPNHYTLPPTSLQDLRRRFGTATFWGDLNAHETRLFYKQQLPKALSIDGALGLSLEERATIASANRHALRMYARERCHLPARVIARMYDGLRHLYIFGSWNSDGMTWEEVKLKYSDEAKKLGLQSDEEILLFVYNRIVDRSSVTNSQFDEIAKSLIDGSLDSNKALALLLKSILESPKLESLKSSRNVVASSSKEEEEDVTTKFLSEDVVLKISKLPSLVSLPISKLFSL